MCWKSIFFKSLQFFQGRTIWITFGWGALGAETLCLSGVKICPWNTLGGNLGGQVENVCPLGAEKGQNLPSSALRASNALRYGTDEIFRCQLIKKAFFCIITGQATKEDKKRRTAEFLWSHYWRKVVYCLLPEIYEGKCRFTVQVKFQ